MDARKIPAGEYCYSLVDAAGRSPQGALEHWQHEPHVIARRCPYWQRTAHGTVRCAWLGVEHLDEDTHDAHALALAHFGSEAAMSRAVGFSLLYDEIKICGVNED